MEQMFLDIRRKIPEWNISFSCYTSNDFTEALKVLQNFIMVSKWFTCSVKI